MTENTNTEREAFEAWIKKDGGDLSTFGSGQNTHYRNSAVNNAWVAWKARASLSLPAAGQEPPPIHALMCVISSLRDTAHFSDEEGEVTEDLRKLRDWIVERAAATQPAVAAGWVPIETAPKDGTPLLLRSKKGRIADGAWITATSSCGGWAWAYVNQEPVEWRHLPVVTAGWQPIESAPKNGQCLLWVDTDEGGEVMKIPRDAQGNWIYEGDPTYCHSFYINPTHWMPLPPAPSTEGESNG